MQNWLVAASKLHNHWGTGCTAEWPYCPFTVLGRCHAYAGTGSTSPRSKMLEQWSATRMNIVVNIVL